MIEAVWNLYDIIVGAMIYVLQMNRDNLIKLILNDCCWLCLFFWKLSAPAIELFHAKKLLKMMLLLQKMLFPFKLNTVCPQAIFGKLWTEESL